MCPGVLSCLRKHSYLQPLRDEVREAIVAAEVGSALSSLLPSQLSCKCFLFLNLTGADLLYSVMVVSSVQGSEPAICTHMSPPSHPKWKNG